MDPRKFFLAFRCGNRALMKITFIIVCFMELYPLRFGFPNKSLQESLARSSIEVDRTEIVTPEELRLAKNASITSVISLSPPNVRFSGNATDQTTTKNITNRSWPPTYQLWNYTTQRLDLPDGYHHSFLSNGRPRPSLLLLESILDHPHYQNHSTIPPTNDSCYQPNLSATRDLVHQVVNGRLHLGLPVLNVGMPKAGSKTLFYFFKCSGWEASHQQNGHKMMPLVANGDLKPLTQSQVGRPQAYTQLDFNFDTCPYPQIQFLDEIHQEFPNATFILNFRPVLDWISSARQWNQMALRWSKCKIPGLHCTGPPRRPQGRYLTCTNNDLSLWWCSHVQHIRKFVEEYPSHTLIELDLYNHEETSQSMAQLFQSNQTCWGHANAQIKTPVIANATTNS